MNIPARTVDEPQPEHGSFNDIKISVRLADMPLDENVTEVFEINSRGYSIEREWLVRQVEGIPFATGDDHLAAPSSLEVREVHHEWGASAAFIEVVLFLVSSVGSAAAWDATKAVARQIAERQTVSRAPSTDHALTEREAEERCRWLLAERYGIQDNDLRLISVEIVDGTEATCSLAGTDGWQYTCRLFVEYGVVRLSSLRRDGRSLS